MDAVFHPRCISDPKVFEQEGWHHELDSADEEMTFKVRGQWAHTVTPIGSYSHTRKFMTQDQACIQESWGIVPYPSTLPHSP